MSLDSLPSTCSSMTDGSLPPYTMSTHTTNTEWSDPSNNFGQYDYETPYVTPHTTAMGSDMNSMQGFSRAGDSYLDLHKPQLPLLDITKAHDTPPSLYGFVPYNEQFLPVRPRSSPSTFSPITHDVRHDQLAWNMNPLGISTGSHQHLESHLRSNTLPSRSVTPQLVYPSTTDIFTPQPRKAYAPIAPHPAGVRRVTQLKHSLEEDEYSDGSAKRRKRSDSNTSQQELGEEDRLLLRLKDEESMSWKDIAARFQSELGKTYQIPALQMRLKRLRERLRVWTDVDVRALHMAHEYWNQNKFEIIASKMIEFGASEKWTARQCARKWLEVDPSTTPATTPYMPAIGEERPPSYHSYTQSPIEGPPLLPYLQMS